MVRKAGLGPEPVPGEVGQLAGEQVSRDHGCWGGRTRWRAAARVPVLDEVRSDRRSSGCEARGAGEARGASCVPGADSGPTHSHVVGFTLVPRHACLQAAQGRSVSAGTRGFCHQTFGAASSVRRRVDGSRQHPGVGEFWMPRSRAHALTLWSAFREQAGLPTTTCFGTTIVSLPTSCRSSPTSCVTPTCAAHAPCPSRRRRTTLTWWPSAPGTTWWTKNMTGKRRASDGRGRVGSCVSRTGSGRALAAGAVRRPPAGVVPPPPAPGGCVGASPGTRCTEGRALSLSVPPRPQCRRKPYLRAE